MEDQALSPASLGFHRIRDREGRPRRRTGPREAPNRNGVFRRSVASAERLSVFRLHANSRSPPEGGWWLFRSFRNLIADRLSAGRAGTSARAKERRFLAATGTVGPQNYRLRHHNPGGVVPGRAAQMRAGIRRILEGQSAVYFRGRPTAKSLGGAGPPHRLSREREGPRELGARPIPWMAGASCFRGGTTRRLGRKRGRALSRLGDPAGIETGGPLSWACTETAAPSSPRGLFSRGALSGGGAASRRGGRASISGRRAFRSTRMTIDFRRVRTAGARGARTDFRTSSAAAPGDPCQRTVAASGRIGAQRTKRANRLVGSARG